jgi:hypothetical protein
MQRVLSANYELRSALGSQPSIEIFFGRLIHLPVFYYFVFFLITTPILVLLFFFLGSKYISDYGRYSQKLNSAERKRDMKWIFYSLIIWFCVPFIQSLYNFRHQGVRFIIEIYAPLALVSGIGFDYLLSKITKKPYDKFVLFLGLVLYLFFVLIRITPYYLDYYNLAVGGTRNVYEKGMFQIGWWGQGIREASYYLRDNAPKGAKIGLAVSPIHVVPPLPGLKVSPYQEKERYDYVLVNYFHVLREGFDDSRIKRDYKLIHEVKADGGVLVFIYKRK